MKGPRGAGVPLLLSTAGSPFAMGLSKPCGGADVLVEEMLVGVVLLLPVHVSASPHRWQRWAGFPTVTPSPSPALWWGRSGEKSTHGSLGVGDGLRCDIWDGGSELNLLWS